MKNQKLAAKEIRSNAPEELQRTAEKLREELFRNRVKNSTNQLENTAQLRKARRDIARIMTVLSEKRRGARTTPENTRSEP